MRGTPLLVGYIKPARFEREQTKLLTYEMEVRRSRRILRLTPEVDEFQDKFFICQGDLVIDTSLDVVQKLIAVENFCTRDVYNRSYNTQISADIAKPQILGGMKMRSNSYLGKRWYARGSSTQRMLS